MVRVYAVQMSIKKCLTAKLVSGVFHKALAKIGFFCYNPSI